MSGSNSSTSTATSLATAALIGDAPLMKGENTRGYDELLGRMTATLQPRDCLEEIWIHDVVDLVWETFRLRRLKARLMTDEARFTIAVALRRHNAEGEALADEWAVGGDAAAQPLASALGSAGLSLEVLTTRAISSAFNLQRLQLIDRMLVGVERRRAAVLRELDTHRGSVAQKLRLAIVQEEEVERRVAAPRLAAEEQP